MRNRTSTGDEFVVSSCASGIRIRSHDATGLPADETNQRQLQRWCLVLFIRDCLDDEACVSGRIEDQRKGVRRGGASMRRSDTHNRDSVVSRVTATISSSSSQHNKLKHPEMSNSDDMCVVHLCAFILTVSRPYDFCFVWKGTWALPETFSAIAGCRSAWFHRISPKVTRHSRHRRRSEVSVPAIQSDVWLNHTRPGSCV